MKSFTFNVACWCSGGSLFAETVSVSLLLIIAGAASLLVSWSLDEVRS